VQISPAPEKPTSAPTVTTGQVKEGTAVGSTAANFTLSDMNGKTVDLNSLRGKKVAYIVFWSGGWGGCIQEVPELNKLYESYKNKGLELLAINCGEDKSDVQKTINDKKIQYPVLLDPDGKVVKTYAVEAIPLSIVVDSNGKILYNDNSIPSEDLIKKSLSEIKI
jgi:peroxiredoxin